MSDEFHAAYSTRRELDERAMGRKATDPRAAAAHDQMTEHYQAVALMHGAVPEPSFPIAS